MLQVRETRVPAVPTPPPETATTIALSRQAPGLERPPSPPRSKNSLEGGHASLKEHAPPQPMASVIVSPPKSTSPDEPLPRAVAPQAHAHAHAHAQAHGHGHAETGPPGPSKDAMLLLGLSRSSSTSPTEQVPRGATPDMQEDLIRRGKPVPDGERPGAGSRAGRMRGRPRGGRVFCCTTNTESG